MIVMHPNHIVPAQHLMELPGELLVHPEICGGVAFRQIGEVETIMTDRPQHAVGEAMVILLDIATRKGGHREGDRSFCAKFRNGFAFLASLARPAEPKSAACLERCFKRNGKASRRGRRQTRGQRHAIRHNHKSTIESSARPAGNDRGRFVQKFKMIQGREDLFLTRIKR